MKITIVSTCANGGGAAKAAYRLHSGLRYIGYDSTMYVQQGRGESIVKYNPKVSRRKALLSRIWRRGLIELKLLPWAFEQYATSLSTRLELYTDARSQFGSDILGGLPPCDVINLHWVANFVDYNVLPLLAKKPLVWTLHDMNPFTGGCHYDDGCSKYLESCGACPQLGSKRDSDLSRKVFEEKQAAFRQLDPGRFHVITPSKWLAEEASRSALMKPFSCTVIPNGLNTDVFAPRNTDELRKTLGIAEYSKVILFVADSITNKRKGMQCLLDALATLRDISKVTLLSVGSGEVKVPGSFQHVQIGRIEDERLLSMIYSLADVFVIPSVQDNFPNTVLEAISCGTPVVGFDVGGIPDMVRNGETGILVRQGDISGLKSAIEGILSNASLREAMSRNCRILALQEYSEAVQAKRYASLYESVIRA